MRAIVVSVFRLTLVIPCPAMYTERPAPVEKARAPRVTAEAISLLVFGGFPRTIFETRRPQSSEALTHCGCSR